MPLKKWKGRRHSERFFISLPSSLCPGRIGGLHGWQWIVSYFSKYSDAVHSSKVASSAWRVFVCLQISLDSNGFTCTTTVTVLVALVAPFFMYDVRAPIHPVSSQLLTSVQFPETASFLTETERRYVIELMKIDSQGLATHYNLQFVLQALKDYKTYLQLGIYMGYVERRSLHTEWYS